MRWRYILPGGRSPFGHYSHRRRKPLRKRFDYGASRNFTIRLALYGYALGMVVLLLIVKLVTHA